MRAMATRDRVNGECVTQERGTTQFGRWLERRMKRQGWTMAELARQTGISEAMVSAWVRGTRGARGPNIQHIRAISDAFGVSRETVLRVFDDDYDGNDERPVDRFAHNLAAMMLDRDALPPLDGLSNDLLQSILQDTFALSSHVTTITLKRLNGDRRETAVSSVKEDPVDPDPSPEAV